MAEKKLNLKLKIWRQKNNNDKGRFELFHLSDVNPDMSFLEMLDHLNENLIREGKEPIYFESDCREGICGSCGLVINGVAHGPQRGNATCQLHMRRFHDGDEISIEPWRAKGFPIIKDLAVDRMAFDRIMSAGGYVSISTGSAPDGNAIPISKNIADYAFNSATCIGCGACVAACKNASAMLFVSAKVSQLSVLPQGKAERKARVRNMLAQMDQEQFGACTNEAECSAVCPKQIPFENIVHMNREFLRSFFSPSELE